MSKSTSYGSVLMWGGVAVSALTKIGEFSVTREAIDGQTHDSPDGYDEIFAGLAKTGELSFEGFHDPADAGQNAMEADMDAGTMKSLSIITPNALTISAASGLITKHSVGPLDMNGLIPFSGSIKPSGRPTRNYTLSAGLTTPFFSISGAGTLIVPTAIGNKYKYVANIATAIGSVTITPTASAGVITITANSVSQVVTSGQPSTAITLGAAGSITTALVVVQETGKVPKLYTIDLIRAAA